MTAVFSHTGLRIILLVLLGFLPVSSALAQEIRSVTVRFPRGSSGTTIEDRITGYESVNYRIGVSAGQRLSVRLGTGNPSNFFNITAPRASGALFNGSVEGDGASVIIPYSGNYTVGVYIMRSAARRGETADYTLTFSVEGEAANDRVERLLRGDYADGLAGGPDRWQVTGVKAGDTLNIRSNASSGGRVLGTLRNHALVRALGCRLNGSTRWCRIGTDSGLQGWVAGRYLRESPL